MLPDGQDRVEVTLCCNYGCACHVCGWRGQSVARLPRLCNSPAAHCDPANLSWCEDNLHHYRRLLDLSRSWRNEKANFEFDQSKRGGGENHIFSNRFNSLLNYFHPIEGWTGWSRGSVQLEKEIPLDMQIVRFWWSMEGGREKLSQLEIKIMAINKLF